MGRGPHQVGGRFLTAGGGITGFQNGLAIAGDYMSAASFLGISASVMASGYDGLIYSIGFLVGWPILTFLLAERLRNLGKFTFADVAGYRFSQTPFRAFAASGTLVVVAFYLIAQMVGAGQLIKLLFGLDYWIAVVLVGGLMMIYVLFGGMTATTWVQIIKACMLLAGVTFMGFMVLAKYGFSPEALFAEGVRVRSGSLPTTAPTLGRRQGEPGHHGPGRLHQGPDLGHQLRHGADVRHAGPAHILMRFFTVPDAKEARKSVFWATTWIGYFYVLIFIIGFGAITLVLTNPEMADTVKGVIHGGAGTANMAAVLVAKSVGGDVFYGFISAVAFATILAVVAGLTLSGASAVSHDLYATVIKKGKADSAAELRVSRITTLTLGAIAVLLGIVFEKQNIAFMVSLAFAVAASANFPAAAVGAVEGLHDQGRRDRRLHGPGVLGGPDHRLAPGLGSHAGQPCRLGLVPLCIARAVLHDHRLRGRVAVLGARQECPGRQGTRRVPRAAGAFGNGSGSFGRLRPLSCRSGNHAQAGPCARLFIPRHTRDTQFDRLEKPFERMGDVLRFPRP